MTCANDQILIVPNLRLVLIVRAQFSLRDSFSALKGSGLNPSTKFSLKNIIFYRAEAQGLDEFDSQYWVGDTLSNQKVRPEYPLTEEEKRTFALLYGPGGFKPDHRTVIPEPKPEEPVQFSVTIGPKKEKKEQQQAEGYVNPMKVFLNLKNRSSLAYFPIRTGHVPSSLLSNRMGMFPSAYL